MKKMYFVLLALVLITHPLLAAEHVEGKTSEEDPLMSADTFAGLQLRSIGPAINSGRITDFAVVPDKNQVYYVATASGGVWKTVNAGTTWTPIFDEQPSYSIGCITLDPTNPNVVWVGTGENNSQRSVAFGDGVYKSLDGGQNWENVGLASSEHIGMITIDPRDTDTVYVAAQGPLWNAGGDRGLYKTTDGGATWTLVLEISPDTGVNEVYLDPRDPDTLYASAYQRRRRVWALLDGGPESAIYKSTDAGATWRKVEEGLPKVDMGKIGLAVSPANPDVIYAIIEAQRDKGGVFRSTDRGETWTKQSDYVAGSPQYYNELVPDPEDVDTIYSMDIWLHVTTDGGKTFTKVGEKHKHVDNHAMWINPEDTDHFLIGCDGGIYDSFDRGATWFFRENLPITQFYRVTVDDSTPFYYVYGGTQDNNTLGGPSRTLNSSGISNEDYFVTVGGDGYKTQIDPTNPDIVYSQWQYGGLIRYDRKSGEVVDIQPQEAPGQDADRWNWDTPLIISPHLHTRLYYASQRLYRSDDRGDTWRSISPDLSRQIDPHTLPVMGKIWGIDAVAKNISTSNYGNIVSLTESPLVEGLIYIGADDGLIQVTEDGGESWRKVDRVPDIPHMTYVSRLEASLHDPDTVYAAFDNHKNGDFKPYIAVSRDRGRTWRSIMGDLPEREIVYAIAQDHEKAELLFAGTEFGLYFSVDEGAQWTRLKGNLPTIAVRDLDIQRRENDLALGTFGRGFYIFDDYTSLREVSEEALSQNAILFPVKTALSYHEKRSRIGSRGHGFWTADNPPFGATFTYYLKNGLETKLEMRIEAEKENAEAGKKPMIPSYEELRAEEQEVEPKVIFTVRDADGAVVRRFEGDRKKGMHRATWDLRYPSTKPTSLKGAQERAPWESEDVGPLALPGRYTATLSFVIDGVETTLASPQEFEVVALNLATLSAEDAAEALAFERKTADLQRAVHGALAAADEAGDRLAHLRKALQDTPAAEAALSAQVEELQGDLNEIFLVLNGDHTRSKRNVFTPPSIVERVDRIVGNQWTTSSAPTETERSAYVWAGEAFAAELARLKSLVSSIDDLESQAEAAGAPWTPGRLPMWEMK